MSHRKVVVLAVLSLGLSMLATAPAVADADPAYPPGWEAPLNASSDFFFEDGLFLEPFIDDLDAAFGARLGPIRIDRAASPAVLRVQLENITPSDETTFEELVDGNDRVLLESGDYSQADIDGFVESIEEILTSFGISQLGTVDDGTGHLMLRVKSALSSTVSNALYAEIPSSVLTVVVMSEWEPRLFHEPRDTYPPHEGAMAVTRVHPLTEGTIGPTPAPAGCSTGFSITSTQFFTNGGVFAGHCGVSGDDIYVGTAKVGDIEREEYWGATTVQVDAGTYSLPGGDNQPIVHLGLELGQGTHRPVTGVVPNSSLINQASVCLTGGRATPIHRCGYIRRVANRPTGDGRRVALAYCVPTIAGAPGFNTGQPGDSGSPFYTLRSGRELGAAGILHGGDNLGVETCFTSAATYQTVTGYQIKLAAS